eukprot:2371269-Rhodomonas_salina.1
MTYKKAKVKGVPKFKHNASFKAAYQEICSLCESDTMTIQMLQVTAGHMVKKQLNMSGEQILGGTAKKR